MAEPVESCEHEPTRIPASIQPHGFLLAIDLASQVVSRMSANAGQYLGREPESLLGRPWQQALPELAGPLDAALAGGQAGPAPAVHGQVALGARRCNVFSHLAGSERIVEFEDGDTGGEDSLDALYPRIRAAVDQLQAAATLADLCRLAAEKVREITGFDRTLLYRFDDGWNGTVVGESLNGRLPSCMGLRFPVCDMAPQAGERVRIDRIRLVPDAQYRPVSIVSAPGFEHALDLAHAALRGIAPAHLASLRAMGTPACMSIAIVVDGEPWGLIGCHHAEPRRASVQARAACEVLAQVIAMRCADINRSADAAERVRRQGMQAELLAFMTGEQRFVDGLLRHGDAFMGLVDAEGAAVILDEECHSVGNVPAPGRLRDIAAWLAASHPGSASFHTEHLAAHMPDAAALAPVASGLLAISISQLRPSYVLWFRPEAVRTVSWGGNPTRPPAAGAGDPARTPSAIRTETVRQRALPWTPAQIDAAAALRNAIIGIVMRRAEELAERSSELQRSNQELEAFSYSVSHDLRAPFRHIVGYAELLKELESLRGDVRGLRYVDTIIESARTAGRLVDGLLGFSQAGRTTLARQRVDMDQILQECLHLLEPDMAQRRIVWNIEPLGWAVGDAGMLRQVFQNLVGNAIKYTRMRDPAVIGVRRRDDGPNIVFSVSDNGVGFDMNYVGKLFGVFQRLHRMEDFEGTGIGLANVKRIAERHGGSVWAEGELGRGATFYFSIPYRNEAQP